jgi:hypothetical protein
MLTKKVEIKMAEAFELQAELTDLLRRKSSMKLKLPLTEILLKIKSRTEPANNLMQELFRDHGEEIGEGAQKQLVLKRYANGSGGDETEHYKDYMALNEQKIEFDSPMIDMDLLEIVESDASYPVLVKIILDSELADRKGN